jgi:hypothetical protein
MGLEAVLAEALRHVGERRRQRATAA